MGVLHQHSVGRGSCRIRLGTRGGGRAASKGARTDIGGAITLTAGLIAATFGVHESIGAGWLSAQTLVPLLGGLGLLSAFVAVERTSPLRSYLWPRYASVH